MNKSSKNVVLTSLITFTLMVTTVISNELGNIHSEERSPFWYPGVGQSSHEKRSLDAGAKRDLKEHFRRTFQFDTYFETDDLGWLNYDVTLGNPLKGLSASAMVNHPAKWTGSLPAAIHTFKLPLDMIMINDPDVVGRSAAFNWTVVDNYLDTTEEHMSHAVLRFYIHWPGQPLRIPAYLTKDPYNVKTLQYQGEVVPWYGDRDLRQAFRQFIENLGRRYDGDKRIYAIQAGLLGAWGEWHTLGCRFLGDACAPTYVRDEVISWYDSNFKSTHIQVRYPERVDAFNNRMGYHDDSFTYETISGKANGDVDHTYFFWNMSMKHGTSDYWRKSPGGGEVRPESVDVFRPTYPSGTEFHQDFMLCVEETHPSYIDWNLGFHRNIVTNVELQNAKYAHSRIGYNFVLSNIEVALSLESLSDTIPRVDIDATIKQVGHAPFYFPLYLDVFCEGKKKAFVSIPNSKLIDKGDTTVVTVTGIPGTQSCLNSVEFRLGSTYMYVERPIKWAQGSDGEVIVRIPRPPPLVRDGRPPIPSPRRSPPRTPTMSQPYSKLRRKHSPNDDPRSSAASIDSIVTDSIDTCFLRCVSNATTCPEGKENISKILPGIVIATNVIENQFTIRCDTDPSVDWIELQWKDPSDTNVIYSKLWEVNKKDQTDLEEIRYLSYPGLKNINITLWSGGYKAAFEQLNFELVDNLTPSSTMSQFLREIWPHRRNNKP